MKEKNINNYLGSPYNLHSQGVVESFHQTIKDMLYTFDINNKDKIYLKECVKIELEKYNNQILNTTKFKSIIMFFSVTDENYKKVIFNMKNSFKYVGKDSNNFMVN